VFSFTLAGVLPEAGTGVLFSVVIIVVAGDGGTVDKTAGRAAIYFPVLLRLGVSGSPVWRRAKLSAPPGLLNVAALDIARLIK
jgi:hypothetical protein